MPNSSDVETTVWINKVTGRMLSEYVKEHCTKMKCSSCGSEDAPLIHAEGDDALAPMYFFREYERPERAMGFYLLSCRHCANMWQLDSQKIIPWALEKSQASEPEEE